jgi:RNA polymerase sigma factor (sigma-70 family)
MEKAKSRGNPIITNATDGQLFAWMSQRGSLAKPAWAELYRRYMKDLHNLMFRVEGLPPADFSDLLQETMKRAYHCAHTFLARDDLDAEASRRRILRWLLQIAKRLFFSKLKRQKDVLICHSIASVADKDSDKSARPILEVPRSELSREIKIAEDKVTAGDEAAENDKCSSDAALLLRALAALPPREKEILLTYYHHYDSSRKKQQFPDDEMNRLKNKYEISAGNIRQIRVRAQDTVKKYMESH